MADIRELEVKLATIEVKEDVVDVKEAVVEVIEAVVEANEDFVEGKEDAVGAKEDVVEVKKAAMEVKEVAVEVKEDATEVKEDVTSAQVAKEPKANKAPKQKRKRVQSGQAAKRDKLKRARIAAVKEDFEAAYGKDASRLDMWQKLCRDVGVDVADSISQCKQNLKGIYINIFDFIADKTNGKVIRTFDSYNALRSYIQKKPGKRYPLDEAKDNLIMTWMLIEVDPTPRRRAVE